MDGKQIRNITTEGVFYLDENATEQFIEFISCYENRMARFLHPDNLKKFQEINRLSDEELEKSIERIKAHREVAYRNFMGGRGDAKPYMQFHTEPPIRFEFATRREFDQICYSIKKTGWRTFDMA